MADIKDDIKAVLDYELALTEKVASFEPAVYKTQLARHNQIRDYTLNRKQRNVALKFSIAVAIMALCVFFAGFGYLIYTVDKGTFDILAEGYKAFLATWLGATAFGVLLTLAISALGNVKLSVGATQLSETAEALSGTVEKIRNKKLEKAQIKLAKIEADEVAKKYIAEKIAK